MKNMILKAILSASLLMSTSMLFASTAGLEGYWRSMDDRTGEPLSIIEFKKQTNGTYTGTIVHRYANATGFTMTHCTKCPAPFTNKPLLGLEFFSGLTQDPKKPDTYINGKIVEPKSGNIYNGKARVSSDGRRLHLRGYQGVSILGRTQVWLRVNDFQEAIKTQK